MSQRWVSLFAVLVVLGLCRFGWSLMVAVQREDTPLEVLVTESEAIVTGTVEPATPTTAAAPEVGALQRFPRRMPVTVVQLKVDKVLTSRGKVELAGKKISINVATGPAYATGTRIIAALTSAEKDQWATMPFRNAIVPFSDAAVEKIKAASDTNAWPWSKAVNGLQAAVFVKSATPVNSQNTAWIKVCVALRNMSKESIWINVCPGDRLFTFKATWDGTPTPTRGNGAAAECPYVAEEHAVEIKPGEHVFIAPGGKSAEGMPYAVDPAGAEGRGLMTYRSDRDAQAPSGAKLWKGTLECLPVTLRIPETPKRGLPR